MNNNTFYDYFSESGDGYRHAVGVHFGNNFQMSIKNAYLMNHHYYNTPREIQTAMVSSSVPGSAKADADSPYPWEYKFGQDFGTPPLVRDLGEGEKTFGIIDY